MPTTFIILSTSFFSSFASPFTSVGNPFFCDRANRSRQKDTVGDHSFYNILKHFLVFVVVVVVVDIGVSVVVDVFSCLSERNPNTVKQRCNRCPPFDVVHPTFPLPTTASPPPPPRCPGGWFWRGGRGG